jgi:hypothetical protein
MEVRDDSTVAISLVLAQASCDVLIADEFGRFLLAGLCWLAEKMAQIKIQVRRAKSSRVLNFSETFFDAPAD